jgi:hypothetical protein
MHVQEKSDCAVLPVNQPNNEGQPSAEVGEGGAQTEENIVQSAGSEDSETMNVCKRRNFSLQLTSSGTTDIYLDSPNILFQPATKNKAKCPRSRFPLRNGRRHLGSNLKDPRSAGGQIPTLRGMDKH